MFRPGRCDRAQQQGRRIALCAGGGDGVAKYSACEGARAPRGFEIAFCFLTSKDREQFVRLDLIDGALTDGRQQPIASPA